MKKILLIALLFCSVITIGQVKADSTAIKEAVLNYIEGY